MALGGTKEAKVHAPPSRRLLRALHHPLMIGSAHARHALPLLHHPLMVGSAHPRHARLWRGRYGRAGRLRRTRGKPCGGEEYDNGGNCHREESFSDLFRSLSGPVEMLKRSASTWRRGDGRNKQAESLRVKSKEQTGLAPGNRACAGMSMLVVEYDPSATGP